MNSANMTPVAENDYSLEELQKEARMGAFGQETFEREVRVIDLSNFEQRKYEIADQLWSAATDIGFFQVSNHGIPLEQIQTAFEMTQQFFNLPESIKARYPLNRNAGWESKAQVRPSTSTPDQKESYQITRPRMEGLYPSQEELPNFKDTMLEFEHACWQSPELFYAEFVALIEKHPRSVHVYGFRGMALLPYVAGEGRIDLTEHLLSIGIDINKDGPLEAALDNCQLEVVKLLLEKGADPNLDRTLISAINADEHSFEFVKLLVEHGADIHRCFTFGPPGTPLVNALSWSIVKGEEEIEEYLRSLGAEMPEGVTPGPDKPWWKFW